MISEYRDFVELMDLKGRYKSMPRNWDQVSLALKRFGHGIFCLIIMATIQANVDFDYMTEPEYALQPFWKRWLYPTLFLQFTINIMATGMIWQEANMIATGHGYHPKTEQVKEVTFNNERSMCYFDFQLGINNAQMACTWNISVYMWCKNYVFLRWLDKSKAKNVVQLLPIFVTYISNSIMHGPDLGFLLFFFIFALLDV